jgi:hypothetical protein
LLCGFRVGFFDTAAHPQAVDIEHAPHQGPRDTVDFFPSMPPQLLSG